MQEQKRTSQQNKSVHLYCEMIARILNDEGLTVQVFLEKVSTVDVLWIKDLVKEIIWRRIQKAAFKKQSTTQLFKTGEIDKMIDYITKLLAECQVESPPFPSMDMHNN